MAIKLEDKQNVQAPDSDYPYGQIKDDTGAGDGTPVNVAVYGDFHQFFARMFALSGLTFNGLPDNDYSGFQYIEAANKLWKSYIGVLTLSANTTELLTYANIGYFINAEGNTVNKRITLPSAATCQDGDSITVYNNSNFQIELYKFTGNNINGNSNLYLSTTGDFVTLVLDKPNLSWKIANYKVTATPYTKITQEITLATQSTASSSYVDMTGLTYTNTSGVSKKFKFTVKGDAELSAVAATNTAGCGGKVKILNDTTATDLDISRLEITIIVIGPINDIVACLPINCQTIKTIAAGDTVKCQFLNDADGIKVKEVKFLIEELEL